MNVRILLAEDNEINREVVQEMLLAIGLESDHVADGAGAVEAALSGRYALVLMDGQMPVMDGFAATARIRAEEARRRSSGGRDARIPIIALTASAMKEDHERGVVVGMDDYLTKPLRLDVFAATVTKWLKTSESTADNDMIAVGSTAGQADPP